MREFLRGHLLENVMPFWERHGFSDEPPGLDCCIGDDGTLLSDDPEENEQRADDELVEHMRLISWAELTIAQDTPEGMVTVRIGGGPARAYELTEEIFTRRWVQWTAADTVNVKDTGSSTRASILHIS